MKPTILAFILALLVCIVCLSLASCTSVYCVIASHASFCRNPAKEFTQEDKQEYCSETQTLKRQTDWRNNHPGYKSLIKADKGYCEKE